MKMANAILLACAMTAGGAFGAATVSEVIVRQQWPWKPQVNVDFTVVGSQSEVAEMTMGAYSGTRFLGYVPPAKCHGDTIVTSNGPKRITFDPTEIPFLVEAGTMADFRIDVIPNVTDPEDILYMIFDLRKTPGEEGQVEYVTAFSLTNGVWGTWEKSRWGMLDTPSWTGVTEDDKYKTTHLVVRRIPAGAFTYGTTAGTDAYRDEDIVRKSVSLDAYYIGVFETTVSQYNYIQDKDSQAGASMKPSTYKYYRTSTAKNAIRGNSATGTGVWPTNKGVRSNGIMGLLRARTGLDFDLPTEAQWEKAARGGSSGIYYSSNSESFADTQNMLKTLAWCRANDANVHEVGLKLPNDFGLYDVLGNVGEVVLDWYASAYVPADANPDGPDSPSEASKRVTKGYTYYGWEARPEAESIHLGGRDSITDNDASTQIGYRVCCPSPF